jgi:hypothetical protein
MRISVDQMERQMAGAGGKSLEEILEVSEGVASGPLNDYMYVLDGVGGKRIAIAPAALKQRFKRPATT